MIITMIVLNQFTHDARVHKEAKTLAANGHDVEVLALHKAGLPLLEERSNYRVRRISLELRWHRTAIFAPFLKYLELIRAVSRVTKDRHTDVFHSHDGNSLLASYPSVRRDDAFWIYDSHELETGRNFTDSNLPKIYLYLWPQLERLFIKRVDAVISANSSYARQLVKQYGINEPFVIQNCPEFYRYPKTRMLHDKIGLHHDRRILLYQGNVVSGRGISTCVRSLIVSRSDVNLVILGDGPNREEYELLATELGLADKVHFLGYIPMTDLLSYTASADIGLTIIQNSCPSYYYSLPNKIFEYMMAGIPVVTSDFPETGPIVRDNGMGVAVRDPKSPEDVASAIDYILEDKERFEKMRRNALRGSMVYNWENESKKLVDAYASLVATLKRETAERRSTN